jgi:hypothetical protein
MWGCGGKTPFIINLGNRLGSSVCGKANSKRDEGTATERRKTVIQEHTHTEGEAHKIESSRKRKREDDSRFSCTHR